jgi:ClpP class serine protease
MSETQRKPAERVLAAIMGEAWAITERGYDKLIEIASRENTVTAEVLKHIEERREAVLTRRAARMENSECAMKRDGVALIEITGPIFRYADMFTSISGAASVQTLATDFAAAMADTSTNGVALIFDTPGGQVSGINEFANQIVELRAKYPHKRVFGYITAQAASAGYWLASACEEIVIDATAEAGSIGAVVSARIPPATSDRVERVSSNAPRKRLSPATEAGQQEMQKAADAIEEVFLGFVRAHRPKGLNTLDGGMAMGQAAVDAKLADRVGSLEQVIKELGRPRVAAASTNQRKGVAMSSQNTAETEVPNTAEENPKILEMQARLAKMEADLNAERSAREAAVKEKLTAEANAKVAEWEREGRITGNATAQVREVYVAVATGEKVSAEQIEKMVAALPKFDTSRVAPAASKEKETTSDAPTKEDFLAFEKGNKKASAKVNAYVTGLVAKDSSKTFTQHLTAARVAAFAN